MKILFDTTAAVYVPHTFLCTDVQSTGTEQCGTRMGFCFFGSLDRGGLKKTVVYVSGNIDG